MKIAVLSDIHDHIWNLEKVLKQIKRPPARTTGSVNLKVRRRASGSESKVEAIIFCGDMCAPFTSAKLGSLGLPVYACLGNTDEDHLYMAEKGGKNYTWVPLGKEFGNIKLGGRRIAFNHYPKLAELLAKSGDYDAVFHGHTHSSRKETHGKTLLLNPGAICGIQGGKPGIASYAVYDTKDNSAKIIKIV